MSTKTYLVQFNEERVRQYNYCYYPEGLFDNTAVVEGNFIKRFHSAAFAAREVGALSRNITLVCSGYIHYRVHPDGVTRPHRFKSCKGFKWRWSTVSNK